MAEHIKWTNSGDPRNRKTDGPWMEVNAQVGDVVAQWAQRSDLKTYMGKEAGAIAAAVFFPDLLQIEINTDAAFGDHIAPRDVGDLRERKTQFKFARAAGAIMHEAGHARFTPTDAMEPVHKALTPNQWDAFMLLEETRMESRIAEVIPQNRSFLRACALGIVLGDIEEAAKSMSGTRAAAHTAALSSARVDAGVLEKVDIKRLESSIEGVLGSDLLSKLRRIWIDFQACTNPIKSDAEIERMKELAIEWNKLVQEAAEEKGEGAERANGNGHEGDGKDGQPIQIDEETMKKILEAFEKASGDAEIGAAQEGAQQIQFEIGQEKADADKAAREEKAKSSRISSKVFTDYTTPKASGSSSTLVSERDPKPEERRAAHVVATELEKAKYQDRIRIESKAALPPGRIHMRSVIQQDGMRESNKFAQTEPFKQVKRRHAEDPDLVIGIMVDISGSMGGAMEPMSVTAWVVAEAVRRIQGTAAMVYYGAGVFPTLKPNQTLPKVRIFDASDPHEECGEAARALDGALNLVQGSGARLVVIVSDGQYRPRQEAELDHMLTLFERSGVGVLWVGYGSSSRAEAKCTEHGNMEFIRAGDTPAKVAVQIGRAAAKALTNASQILNSRG